MNSLEYFFSLIEDMDKDKRDDIFSFAYMIWNDKDFNYETFKTKVQAISHITFNHFLITSIVNYTLFNLFNFADTTRNEEFIKDRKRTLKWAEKVKSGEIKVDTSLDPRGIDLYIKKVQEAIDELPETNRKFTELYNYFCDTVVAKLFNQSLPDVLGIH